MKFLLVDRIVAFEPGKRIVTEKALSLAEEYLADHFPRFPVLPGVLMLEAMVQAGAWLVRLTQGYAASVIVLKEARNVTYRSFLAPGQILTIEADCKEMSADQSVYSALGNVGGREIVKARLVLRHLCLADSDPALAEADERLRAWARGWAPMIWRERAASAQPAGAA